MDEKEILTTFASRFVQSSFRERFVHEAMKKPVALHRRISHEIEKVFSAQYKGQPPSLADTDECLFLGWSSGFVDATRKEARAKMAGGGGGFLVVKADGTAFYAETEAYPAVSYAGRS